MQTPRGEGPQGPRSASSPCSCTLRAGGQLAAALLVSHSGPTRPKEEIGERKHLSPRDSGGGGNFPEATSRAGQLTPQNQSAAGGIWG